MSIKIYNGFKFPIVNLRVFLSQFHKKSLENIVECMRNAADKMNMDKINAEMERAGIRKEGRAPDDVYKYALIFGIAGRASKKETAFANYDCWVNIFAVDDVCLAYAPYDKRFTPTIKDIECFCEDYSYWNNTDPPEDVDYDQWMDREILWEKAGAFDDLEEISLKLTHRVIEFGDPLDRAKFQLGDMIFKDDKDASFATVIYGNDYMRFLLKEDE